MYVTKGKKRHNIRKFKYRWLYKHRIETYFRLIVNLFLPSIKMVAMEVDEAPLGNFDEYAHKSKK